MKRLLISRIFNMSVGSSVVSLWRIRLLFWCVLRHNRIISYQCIVSEWILPSLFGCCMLPTNAQPALKTQMKLSSVHVWFYAPVYLPPTYIYRSASCYESDSAPVISEIRDIPHTCLLQTTVLLHNMFIYEP